MVLTEINFFFVLKNIILTIILVLLVGCHYNSNRNINQRKPPVIIVAIDTTTKSIVLRDGDNKVFTISNTSTTEAISKSLCVGDTIRTDTDNKW